MNRSQVTTYILAGGRSRRFGSDKALLRIEGKWVVDLILAGLGDDLANNVYLSGPERPELSALPLRGFIPDAEPDAGPLAGIAACLAQCETPAALFVACDMPYSAKPARTLVDCHDPSLGSATLYGGGEGGKMQPLPFAIDADLAARAQSAARSETRALQHFLNLIAPVILPPPAGAGELFLNVNRPSDLEPG